MKVLLIDKYGEYTIKDAQIIPRVGDKVFTHKRTVTSVVMWPDRDYISEYLSNNVDIEAIIVID